MKSLTSLLCTSPNLSTFPREYFKKIIKFSDQDPKALRKNEKNFNTKCLLISDAYLKITR